MMVLLLLPVGWAVNLVRYKHVSVHIASQRWWDIIVMSFWPWVLGVMLILLLIIQARIGSRCKCSPRRFPLSVERRSTGGYSLPDARDRDCVGHLVSLRMRRHARPLAANSRRGGDVLPRFDAHPPNLHTG